jgi:flagellar biosynthesis/type III secretory pathway protein FliH
MADKTVSNLKTVGVLVALILAIVSPIIAVDRANNSNEFRADAAAKTANEAKEIALRAEKQTQDNAKDFEYFKGKLEGTIKGLEKGMDSMDKNHRENYAKMDNKIDKLELKIDEVLKIMVRFKRADLDAK